MTVLSEFLSTAEEIANAFAPGVSNVNVDLGGALIPGYQMFYLTFFLIFALTFVLLEKIPFMAEVEKRNTRALVSFIIAFMVAQNSIVISIISSLFPAIGIYMIFALGLMILIALFIPKLLEPKDDTSYFRILGLILVIFLLLYITTAGVIAQEALQQAGIDISLVSGITEKIDISGGTLIYIVLVAGLFLAILMGGKPKPKTPNMLNWLFSELPTSPPQPGR